MPDELTRPPADDGTARPEVVPRPLGPSPHPFPPGRLLDFMVIDALVGLLVGQDATGERDREEQENREILEREVGAVAAQLAGPAPTPAERLLCETAAVNWLALRALEARSLARDTAEAAQRRIDRAHRRLLASLKTLATVRKLGVAIQINVGRNQQVINGPVGAPTPAKPPRTAQEPRQAVAE